MGFQIYDIVQVLFPNRVFTGQIQKISKYHVDVYFPEDHSRAWVSKNLCFVISNPGNRDLFETCLWLLRLENIPC